MATCDPNDLLEQSKSFQGCDRMMLKMAILQLLCDAAAGGGGGGGSLAVKDDGSTIVASATALNFTGLAAVTDAGGNQANVDVALSSGQSTLASDYELTNTLSNTGLSVNLPAAGTYLITVDVTIFVLAEVGANIGLYNATLAAPIAGTERIVIYYVDTVNYLTFSAGFTFRVTVGAASTINLQAYDTADVGGYGNLYADATAMQYVKIG